MAAFVKTRNIIDSATNSWSTADVDITDEYDATPFQCSSVHVELEDDHESETINIIGFDCQIDLAVYRYHLRCAPYAYPEPPSGPCHCYALDPIETTDLTLLSSHRNEDDHDTDISNEEYTLVPEMEEYIPSLQDAEVIVEGSEPVNDSGQNVATIMDSQIIHTPEMAAFLMFFLIWYLFVILKLVRGMSNKVYQFWHGEDNQEAKCNQKDEPGMLVHSHILK